MYCYCKKDFKSDFSNEILFHEGKIYEMRYEDDGALKKYVWLTYNKNGGVTDSGVRFHIVKGTHKISSIYNFYEYFLSERATKLKNIENFQKNLR